MAKLLAEDVRDPLEDRVARQVAVVVVDLAEEVEVGHDQGERPVEALGARELLGECGGEMACVEESRLRVDAGLHLQRGDGQ